MSECDRSFFFPLILSPRLQVELGEEANDPVLFIHFAKFEERMKEVRFPFCPGNTDENCLALYILD